MGCRSARWARRSFWPFIPLARCRCCATAMSRCSNPGPSPAISIAASPVRSFPGPQLFPSDPHLAAFTEQWVSLVNTAIDRTLIRTYLYAYIAPKTPDGKPDRAAIDAVMPAVRAQLEILDRAVAVTGYLAGDQFTFADINLLPILDRVGCRPRAPMHSRRPVISPPITRGTRRGRALCARCRRPHRPAGPG